jgi:hypothetical protein
MRRLFPSTRRKRRETGTGMENAAMNLNKLRFLGLFGLLGLLGLVLDNPAYYGFYGLFGFFGFGAVQEKKEN